MIITIKQLKARVKKHGSAYYRFIGRTRSDDGLHSYAIINDCFCQQVLHVEEDDEEIVKVCDECEYKF